MSTKKTGTTLDLISLDLGREARMVAYLSTRKSHGKVKIKELNAIKRVRDAILGDCAIDMKTGQVDWEAGVITFRDTEDFATFARAIDKALGDDGEGVEFDLVDGALEVLAAIDAERSRQRMQEEAVKTANTPPPTGEDSGE